MALKKGLFSGIKEAKPRVDANYLGEGHYFLVINRVKAGESRKGEAYVVFEMTVLHYLGGCKGTPHALRESVSHMMMQKHDNFLGNIKTILEKILGVDDDTSAEDLEAVAIGMCDEEKNPLGWTCVEVENRLITLQNGNPFTVINYKREVPISEIGAVCEEKTLEKVFPDGLLERLVEAE